MPDTETTDFTADMLAGPRDFRAGWIAADHQVVVVMSPAVADHVGRAMIQAARDDHPVEERRWIHAAIDLFTAGAHADLPTPRELQLVPKVDLPTIQQADHPTGPELATADDVITGRARYADTPGGHADRRALTVLTTRGHVDAFGRPATVYTPPEDLRPCPTCNSGASRETSGMVCQTCGTDYGVPADSPAGAPS